MQNQYHTSAADIAAEIAIALEERYPGRVGRAGEVVVLRFDDGTRFDVTVKGTDGGVSGE